MPKTKKQSGDKKRKLQKEKRKGLEEKAILEKKEADKIKNEIQKKKIAIKRRDPEFLNIEKEKKAIKRQDPEYLNKEIEKMSIKRQDPEYVQIENRKRAIERQDSEYVQLENEKRAIKRQNPEYLAKEKERKAVKRSDPLIYENEKEKIVERRKNLFSQDPELHEKFKETAKEHIANKRLDPEFVKLENSMAKERMADKRKANSLDVPNKKQKVGTLAFEKFRRDIREGQDTVCSCCNRLWFSSSCCKINRQTIENLFGTEFCNAVFLNGESNVFCQSCERSIRKNAIPTFCASNYNIVFPIPNELKNLTIMEERMIALRIPFMKITSGFTKQCSITGQIVNVPMNLDTSTSVLPRNVQDTHTIQIKLKRKMEYKQSYIHETVRPGVVLKALDYLLKQPLYQEQNVEKSVDWEDNIQEYFQSVDNIQNDTDVNKHDLKRLEQIADLKEFGINADSPPNLPMEVQDMENGEETAGLNESEIRNDSSPSIVESNSVDTQFKRLQNIAYFKEFGINLDSQPNLPRLEAQDIDLFNRVMNAGLNESGIRNDSSPSIVESNSKCSTKNIADSLKVMTLTDQYSNEVVKLNLPSIISKENFGNIEDIWADENLFEDEEPVNPGGQETLLENEELENICFAPGENNKPIHLMLDKYAEELSFPTLFCGQKKEYPETFSYMKQVKVQAQNADRRFARTDFLLYMSKKLLLINVVHAVQMALRQKLNQQGQYTAGEMCNPVRLNQLIETDAGYMFLKKIKNSPAYWKNEQRKLMSMVRQLNIPTIFFTVSAAETRWPELLQILTKVVDGKTISEEEALNLPYSERVRLIRADAVTCASYFNHRFSLLFKHMKSNRGPFKDHPIQHFYYRVEMQNRGSPHIHGLLWLHNAPRYDCNDAESGKICSEFADQYITCDKSLVSIEDIISYNTHRHTRSCRREVRGKYTCRYGIPYLPMDVTTILDPLESNDQAFLKEMKEKYSRIMELLNKKNPMSFEEFLQTLGLEKQDYLNIIQYNIKKPTMYIKRRPDECFINHFNEEIFSMQKSNMDIQFVLDPYACLKYIVNYINKSERGISQLMREASDEIKKGNFDLKERLKKLGHVFLNGTEISAQEAAYNVLGLPIHQTCTGHTFINTKPINQRVRMLKSNKDLKLLDPDDKDIYSAGVVEHYIQRPDELSDICLADFAAHYVFRSTSTNSKKELGLKDGSGVVTYKEHANIISYIRYGLQQDPVNFYREQLMLYVPFRNETNELENVDQQLLYSANFETIKTNRAKYDVLDSKILDDALEKAQQREDDITAQLPDNIDKEFIPYAIDEPDFDAFKILDKPMDDILKRTYVTPFQIPDGEYNEMIKSLNLKQYEFLNHVLDSINREETIYNIVGGGAGVGKSRLISAIYQSVLRYYNSIPGNDPDTIKILLTAPTGKAAFGIEGATLHSALSLPVNKGYEQLVALSNDLLNTMYCHLHDLKLIIIDEFSMVGSKMFDNINQRLQQLFKSTDDFGGISILLFGDLRQLPPVGDKWIFEPLKSNPYHEICGTYLWDKFTFFELTEIMRQRDDKAFALALNNMANGIMSINDIQLIKSRQVTEDGENLPDNIIHLFVSNNEVDEFNAYKLSTLDTENTISVATDIVKGSCNERLQQQHLKAAQNLRKSDTFGLMVNLKLQVGAKYMVSLNIDTADGIVNGATGLLMKIDYDNKELAIRCWIEFFDSRSGKTSRLNHANYMKANNIPKTWTPIEKTTRGINVFKGSNIGVERSQFPLLISEGITIHKSQGATYQQVAVHLRKGITRNAVYVACSRATNLSGLYIFGDFEPPRKPTNKDKGFQELQNLKANKRIESTFNRQYCEATEEKQTLIFQNVQSLRKHVDLLRNNPLYRDADILIFVETWLKNEDIIEFDNFECFVNISDTTDGQRKPYGIACYRKKNTSSCTNIRQYRKIISFRTFQAAIFSYWNVTIIAVYIPPKLAISNALKCLKEIVTDNEPTIIMGDFNHDLSVNNVNCLQQFLISKGFTSQLDTNQSTTNVKTHIDWCFSNVKRIKSHIYTTVYSHHKAISFNLYRDSVTHPRILNERKQVDRIGSNLNKIQIKLTNDDDEIFKSFNHNSMETVQSADQNDSVMIVDDNNDKMNADSITSISDIESFNNNYSTKTVRSENYNDSVMMIDDINDKMKADSVTSANYSKFGLDNSDGVSCYANSSVQCLLSITEFRPFIASYSNSPISDKDKIKKAINDIATGRIRNSLQLRGLVGDPYNLREQQDAHMFMVDLLNKFRDELFLTHIRFSYIPNVEYCGTCNRDFLGREMTSLSMNLYLPQDPPPIIDFKILFSPRPTENRCNICQSNLTSRERLITASKYLILCVNRTQQVNDMLVKRLTTFRHFNENLIDIDDILFELKAVTIHISTDPNDIRKGGHYMAHIKYDNEWWEFNDSIVTKKPFDRTLNNVTIMVLKKLE